MTTTTTAPYVLTSEEIEALIEGVSPSRRETMMRAVELGASPPVLATLRSALRVGRGGTVVLPAHRLEGLSRGRGWARLGKGDDAEWGERVPGGYKVSSPGAWEVGGTDGFSRGGREKWTVECLSVGEEVWTIAN